MKNWTYGPLSIRVCVDTICLPFKLKQSGLYELFDVTKAVDDNGVGFGLTGNAPELPDFDGGIDQPVRGLDDQMRLGVEACARVIDLDSGEDRAAATFSGLTADGTNADGETRQVHRGNLPVLASTLSISR